jgi:hypothetical protein
MPGARSRFTRLGSAPSAGGRTQSCCCPPATPAGSSGWLGGTAPTSCASTGPDALLAHCRDRGLGLAEGVVAQLVGTECLWLQHEGVEVLPADSFELNGLGPQVVTVTSSSTPPPGATALERDRWYWERAVPRCTFRDGALAELTLHPATLGHGLPRSRRGQPRRQRAARAAV